MFHSDKYGMSSIYENKTHLLTKKCSKSKRSRYLLCCLGVDFKALSWQTRVLSSQESLKDEFTH